MRERKQQKGSLKRFLILLRQLHWPKGLLVVALMISILSTIVSLIVPLMTKEIVDAFANAQFSWKLGTLLLGVFLLQAFLGGISYYLLATIGEKIVADLRYQLWSKVLYLPLSYYDGHETGETMSRITQDTSLLKQLVSDDLITLITGMISIIGAVFLLFLLDWKLTLIVLISVPLSVAIILPLGNKMHKIAQETQQQMANFSSHLSRVLGDIRLVKAYNAD